MTELSKPPVSRIVDAVADAESVDPLSLDPPLAAVVDPEALETLLREPTPAGLEVRFTYRGHDVVVDADGRVQLD